MKLWSLSYAPPFASLTLLPWPIETLIILSLLFIAGFYWLVAAVLSLKLWERFGLRDLVPGLTRMNYYCYYYGIVYFTFKNSESVEFIFTRSVLIVSEAMLLYANWAATPVFMCVLFSFTKTLSFLGLKLAANESISKLDGPFSWRIGSP